MDSNPGIPSFTMSECGLMDGAIMANAEIFAYGETVALQTWADNDAVITLATQQPKAKTGIPALPIRSTYVGAFLRGFRYIIPN